MACKASLHTKQLVGAICVILIITTLTLITYTTAQKDLRDSVRAELKTTAGIMATQVKASDIDGLKPGDEQSPQYLAVVNNLKSMRSMNDEIVNTYILKVNPDQSITFIVDDLYPEDPQGSAKIGEVYLTPDKLDIFAALSMPTASQVPYTDKYGSFMSGYAPIDDSVSGPLGNTTAVLGIDMESKDYVDSTARGGLIVLTGIVSIILALGVIWVCGRKCSPE